MSGMSGVRVSSTGSTSFWGLFGEWIKNTSTNGIADFSADTLFKLDADADGHDLRVRFEMSGMSQMEMEMEVEMEMKTY